MASRGWIGVDLDGTLAVYHTGSGLGEIGAPIPAMLARVKKWVAEGQEVRIVTARADPDFPEQEVMIREWCIAQGLPSLAVTVSKDFRMIALYDDRAVQVEANTGRLIGRAHDEQEA